MTGPAVPWFAAAVVLVGWQLWRKSKARPSTAAVRRSVLRAIHAIARGKRWDRHRACVILSGGLDSGISAEVGGPLLGLTDAITVIASDSATDLPYAVASATAAGVRHHVVHTSVPQLLEAELPTVVRVMQSFDPMSLRNEIAISAALRKASELGCTCAVTGDGADELFGGYSFTHGLTPDQWKYGQRRMAQLMAFGSVPLGAALGIHVTSPFTQRGVVRMALRHAKDDCIASAGGPGGQPLGKMPLRHAFPHVTSALRGKDPIEVGCGTTALSKPHYFQETISDDVFAAEVAKAAREEGITIRDKEHLYYYWAFRREFPEGEVPGKQRDGPHACPKCRYPLRHPTQTFCHTCGHYDRNMTAVIKQKQASERGAAGTQ